MADRSTVAVSESSTVPVNCGTNDGVNTPHALGDVSSSSPTAEVTIATLQPGSGEDVVRPPSPVDASRLRLEGHLQELKVMFEAWECKYETGNAMKTPSIKHRTTSGRARELMARTYDIRGGIPVNAVKAKLNLIEQEVEYIEEYESLLDEYRDEIEGLEEKVEALTSELKYLRLTSAHEEKPRVHEEKPRAHEEEPSTGTTHDTKSEGDGSHPRPLRPELNRVEWKRFKALRLEPEYFSAIDILEGDPAITYEDSKLPPWQLRWAQRAGIVTSEKEPDTGGDKGQQWKRTSAPGQAPAPERIRINSIHIIRILEEIHGEKMVLGEDIPLVMTRPYKALVYYDSQIRAKFRRLQFKFGDGIGHADQDGMLLTSQPTNPKFNATGGDLANAEDTKSLQAAAAPNQQHPLNEHESDEDESDEYTFSRVAFLHLRCLIEFLDTEIETKLRYLTSDQCQKVAFTDVWYLFKPGDEVVGQGPRQAYRVISVTSTGHKVRVPSRPWEYNIMNSAEAWVKLHCAYIDFDGKQLGPVVKTFTIAQFDGEKAVTALEAYPLRLAEDREFSMGSSAAGVETFREQLVARGKMFLDVAGVKHMHYNGFTLETRDEVDSQVVVDFVEAIVAASVSVNGWQPTKTGWQPIVESLIGKDFNESKGQGDEACSAMCCKNETVHQDGYAEKKRNEDYIGSLMPQDPTREPSIVLYPRTLKDARSPGNALNDDDLVIMSYRVFGFVLRSRKWAKLDLKYMTSVSSGKKKKETAFEQLVLPKGHKDMVQCLIAQHFRDKEAGVNDNEEVDIVRGKGKGLIILLHGAPGVGKTTTAEGVAEMFERPLFQITCGDLGTTAGEVEVALERHFSLASRWGCILLLDEADVFLAQRSPQDFIRNGLVAVFLRVLEYYAGILFLTTNRIGDFDEAFASRIHISLHYPPLNRKSTRSIFELNLRMIRQRFEEKNRKIKVEDDEILCFAVAYWREHKTMRWNGRQIRNACQTALALAEFEAQGGSHEKVKVADAEVKLTAQQFKVVSDAYLEFIRYLKNIYGKHAERRAKEIGIRAREGIDPKTDEEDDDDDDEKGAGNAKGMNTDALETNRLAASAAGTVTTPAEASVLLESMAKRDPGAMAAAVGFPPFLAPGAAPNGFPAYSSPFMMYNPQAFAQAAQGGQSHVPQPGAPQPGYPPNTSNTLPGNSAGWPNMNPAAWQAMMAAGGQMPYPSIPGSGDGTLPPGLSRGQ